MKAVVTGGAGFIGSHIAIRLVKEGHEITVIDNLNTGDFNNLSEIEGKYKKMQAESAKVSELDKVDVVFHQGIYSSSPMYRNDRALLVKAISDFHRVCEYCSKSGAKLVFASTSSIYNGHKPPHTESMTPMVKDFYTEARYPMERLAELYAQMFGMRYCALRYFSVYGDHEESKKGYANLVTQFIWKGLLDKTMKIFGDGSQRRDLINVNDVVSANLAAATKDVNGVFNVGNGVSYTLNDIKERVGKAMGKEIKSEYIKNPMKNYVDVVEADTTKMKNVLGFAPQVKLDDGIRSAVDYYKELKEIPDVD